MPELGLLVVVLVDEVDSLPPHAASVRANTTTSSVSMAFSSGRFLMGPDSYRRWRASARMLTGVGVPKGAVATLTRPYA